MSSTDSDHGTVVKNHKKLAIMQKIIFPRYLKIQMIVAVPLAPFEIGS